MRDRSFVCENLTGKLKWHGVGWRGWRGGGVEVSLGYVLGEWQYGTMDRKWNNAKRTRKDRPGKVGWAVLMQSQARHHPLFIRWREPIQREQMF